MRKKGFTLLELIIVIVIIGILATFAMPRYFRVTEKARAAEALSVLGTLRSAQIRVRAERGSYVTNLADLDVDLSPSRFFTPTVQDPGAAGGIVATAERLAAPPNPIDGTVYTITITDDGVLECLPAGSTSCTAVMP